MNIHEIKYFDTFAAFMGRQLLIKRTMHLLLVVMISALCLTGFAPDAQAALQAKVGTFTANSGTGDQSISGVGFQPKAVLFWVSDRTVTGTGPEARFGRGWATGPSEQGVVATAWEDGETVASNVNTANVVMDSNCILVMTHQPNLIARASFVSMDSDGFTINWNVSGGLRLITYLALGGPSLMAHAGGREFPNMGGTSTTYDITGVGFQPDVVLLMGTDNHANFGPSTRGGHGFGVAISPTDRHSSAHRWRNNLSGDDGTSGIVNDYALIFADDSTNPENGYELDGMLPDGFRLSQERDAEEASVVYLALAGLEVDQGILNQRSSVGNQTISGLSFEPSVVLFDGGDKDGSSEFQVYAESIAGVGTGTSEVAGYWIGSDLDDSDTAFSTSYIINSYEAGSPTLEARAILDSINSDGFTLNWTTADSTQRRVGWIALGAAGATVFGVNPTSMSLMVGETENATISGGTSPYSAVSGSSSVATVTVAGNTVIVTGVGVGTATITVTDDAGDSIDIDVTVSDLMTATPTALNLFPTQIATIYISGGAPGYTVVSGNPDVATAAVSGDEVTIVGVAAGAMTVTITDAADNHVFITVNVGDSIAPGLGACPIPPFAANVMSPNVLLVFDTSGSMNSDDGDGVTRFEEARDAMLTFLAANKNIRFGLMRIDGTDWEDGGRPGGVVGKHNAIKGGRLLVPTGYTGGFATSAEYIIDYINTHMSGTQPDWRNDTGARHWTNLAETLADAGRYFATKDDGSGNYLGKGPAGFGYYKEGTDYTFYYDADSDGDLETFQASITDDHGNTINPTSPLQHSCEQAFVIMFSDGEANCDNDWDIVTDLIGDYDNDGDPRDCKRAGPLEIRPDISDPGDPQYGKPLPTADYACDTRGNPDADDENGVVNYLDDVAKYLFDNDMRSDIPGTQNVITYTIGFYLADQDLLQDTAANGGGQHFTANSIADLTEALQTAMEDIMLKVASGTAVSTITTSSHSDDYLVRAKFFPGSSWRGYLERHNLSNPDFSTPDWEAAALLNARVASLGHGDRKIYTFMSSQTPNKQEFTSTDGAVKTRMATLWSEASAETADIIDYIRGDQTYDGDKYKARNGWVLGDIIYSTPTAVAGPQSWYFDGNILPEHGVYRAFKSAHSSRKTMIYVGSNDGMLHAFDAADGDEDWAFIPENLQAKLKDLTDEDCHKYFVDLTPYVADAWDETEGSGAWKSMLIGGNRFGGEEYFALDITDPAHDQFSAMWDVVPFPTKGILSSTIPVIGKVQANSKSVDHWVAIITSGYHGSFEKGRIGALKISDGTKVAIWENLNYSGGTPTCTANISGYDHAVNPYTVGETITGFDSGATAEVVSITNISGDTATLTLTNINGTFLAGERLESMIATPPYPGDLVSVPTCSGGGDDDDDDDPYVDQMETQANGVRIAGGPYYTMSSPAALDTDLDGYLDVIYAGDTEGTLWKFYYDYENDMWKKFEMFNTGGKAITARPALAFDFDGNLRIYFGTGKYMEESDKANSVQNAFYCLVDALETSGSAGLNQYHYTRTINLTGQLLNVGDHETYTEYDTNLVPADKDTVANKGWYFLLDPVGSNPAERILGKALVVSGTVFVTSFAPNDDICGGGGDSRLYAFDYITATIDVDGTEVLSNYASGKRYGEIGHGVPSEPVYYFNPATKKSSVIIQKSDSEVIKEDPVLKERPMAIQSWKAR